MPLTMAVHGVNPNDKTTRNNQYRINSKNYCTDVRFNMGMQTIYRCMLLDNQLLLIFISQQKSTLICDNTSNKK